MKYFGFLLLFLLSFYANSAYANSVSSGNPHIVVSFSILQDIVKNLVPDDFTVSTLVKPGQDSHGYSASPQDFIRLKKATQIILVGQNFEPWAAKVLEKLKPKGKIYYVTNNLSLLPLVKPHHHNKMETSTNWDPHFWQSPEYTLRVIGNLSNYLQNQFPSHTAEIKNNTDTYLNKLKEIQGRFKAEFSKIPDEKKQIVISHNSLQYFSSEFGVKVDSPLDASQEGESSLQKVAGLIQKIKKENIKNLFLEKSSPEGLMRNIAKETKLSISGTLYVDCLSDGPEASTYLKMLEYNFDLILKSMKGS